ncbi:MAG: cyclic-di-AMP receptor [Chloroflexota bacterium]
MATRLIVSVVQDEDVEDLTRALRKEGFSSTKIGSTGGFLRRGNSTFLIGLDEELVPAALEVIRASCHQRTQLVNPALFMEPEGFMTDFIEVQVGGAVVFVLGVEQMLRV